MENMKEWALKYASMGLRVFPVKKGTKGSNGGQLLRSWSSEASTDPNIIAGWWSRWPDADICIATGNGLLVIDLDVKGNEDGTASLFEWICNNGNLPATAVVKTRSGGQHHYYYVTGTYPNSRGLFSGIDIRSDGGYVVAPPSDGYTWINEAGIAQADQAVYDFLAKKEKPGRFELPAEIPEGGRNDTLFRYAASLQAKGVPDDEILEQIHKANNEKCYPALSDKDVDIIVSSVTERYVKGVRFPDFPDIRVLKTGGMRVEVTARNTAALLEHEGFFVYYDMIRREAVIRKKDEPATGVPQIKYESILTHLTDQYTRVGARTSNSRMHEHISRMADLNRYNAARSYLECNYMIYGGEKGIEALLGVFKFKSNEEMGKKLVRKWLCQCVAMAHNEYGAYGAEGMLVLQGPQGIGKTTFFRKCCSIGLTYFTEGGMQDGSKDRIMINTSSWITELGELPRSMKDNDAMKAFITSATDKYRAPYDKKEDEYPRFTSFGATTNDDTFLKDDANRRYWVVELEDIDLKALNTISFECVWAEAYEEFRINGQRSFRLAPEERAAMETVNRKYRIESEEERLLLDLFDWEQPVEEWKEYTATQIAGMMLGHNISVKRLGRVLSSPIIHFGNPLPKRIKDGVKLYKMPRRRPYGFEVD